MATAELTVAERNGALIQRSADIDPFEPQDWQGLLSLAKMVAMTPFAPKDFQGKPESCAIAMMYGKQLGFPALTALQGIGVINGRPNAFGDLFWAIILSHPEFEDVVEKDEDAKAYVKLTRRNRTPKEVTFTQKDAEIAGLWKKAGPWTNYPKAMLLWRARTIAARALFADALKGITSSYEAEDSGPNIDTPRATSTMSMPGELTQPVNTSLVPDEKITQEQAREFGKAWKASGYAMPEAKAALKRIAGVEASLDIPADKYKQAMQWATKQEPEQSPDEKLCREMFGILEYDLTKQAEAISDVGGDWKALALKLNAELPTEEG